MGCTVRRLQRYGGSQLLTILIALVLLVPPLLVPNKARSASAPIPTQVVLIVLDGARPDYFTVPNIPHVQALMHNGTQYNNAYAGILESETPSGHATLGTGTQPRLNGILSFAWGSGDNDRVNLFDPNIIRSGALEKIMQMAHVPTIAGSVHQLSPQAKVVALSGSKYYAADAIGGPNADVIMYYHGLTNGQFVPTFIPGHPPPTGVLEDPALTTPVSGLTPGVQNHMAMMLAIDTFKRMRQQVTLINLPEFDWPLGHVSGANWAWPSVQVLMQSFDRDLGLLETAYKKAHLLKHTVFVLTADHGFTPLVHRISPTDLRGAIAKAGARVLSESYTTGAYFWLTDKSKSHQAGVNVAALNNPHIQSVYVKSHTSKGYAYSRVSAARLLRTPAVEGANQSLLGSFVGPNGPDVVAFFTERSGSEPGGQASWKGDHGGAAWDSQHIPLILSGPGVRAGAVSNAPVPMIDIAPTILHLVGAPHDRMQGIPLADALQSPPSWAVTWQQGQIRDLQPVVAALQQESKLEIAAGQ